MPGPRTGAWAVLAILSLLVSACTTTSSGSGVPSAALSTPTSALSTHPLVAITVTPTRAVTTRAASTPPAAPTTGSRATAAKTTAAKTTAAKTTAAKTTALPRTTITKTVGTGGVVTAGPPPTTPMAPTVTQDCPYLSANVVRYIAGERNGPSRVTQYKPYPTCTYYHASGAWTGSVQVIVAADPASAIAAVNQHVPVATSLPQNVPAGWSGGSELLSDRAVYGVSRGNIAVIAEEDENEYSAKARNMAVCAIYGLKMEAGTLPAYCLPGTEG